jgi:hypothetical protein
MPDGRHLTRTLTLPFRSRSFSWTQKDVVPGGHPPAPRADQLPAVTRRLGLR